MFDTSLVNLDKFVHSLVQNLGCKTGSLYCKKLERINFICHVNKASKMRRELLCVGEKMKDALVQSSIDFSDARSVQYFLERRTKFLDKFAYSKTVPLLAPHLRNLNKKLVQRVQSMKTQINGNIKRTEKCNNGYKRKLYGQHRKKLNNAFDKIGKTEISVVSVDQNHCADNNVLDKERHWGKRSNCKVSKLSVQDSVSETRNHVSQKEYNDQYNLKNTLENMRISLVSREKYIGQCDPKSNIMEYRRKEFELNQKYLQLHIKNIDFIKRNVHITLYIAIKEIANIRDRPTEAKCQQTLVLCKQAVLCFIKPSKKAFISFEKNLSAVLKNYLLQGYNYHLCKPSNSQDYVALIILSKWAKFLVRHTDITMIHTICGTLGCSKNKILILSSSEEIVQ